MRQGRLPLYSTYIPARLPSARCWAVLVCTVLGRANDTPVWPAGHGNGKVRGHPPPPSPTNEERWTQKAANNGGSMSRYSDRRYKDTYLTLSTAPRCRKNRARALVFLCVCSGTGNYLFCSTCWRKSGFVSVPSWVKMAPAVAGPCTTDGIGSLTKVIRSGPRGDTTWPLIGPALTRPQPAAPC